MGASAEPVLHPAPFLPKPLKDAVSLEPADISSDDETRALRRALEEAQRRIQELEALADIDELTGALNRRGFLRELRRASSYSERYGVAISVGLVDLDLFKHVNDTHGHGAGDAVLVATARFLTHHVRASDVVARIGGDEFAVILWHADEAQAAAKLEGLMYALAGAPVTWRGTSLPVRASAGHASLVPGQPVEDALELADRRLYGAKGRAKTR
jgi:diguanylate cyclase (GGDEF)-like protein